jgi:hypothetical protein
MEGGGGAVSRQRCDRVRPAEAVAQPFWSEAVHCVGKAWVWLGKASGLQGLRYGIYEPRPKLAAI